MRENHISVRMGAEVLTAINEMLGAFGMELVELPLLESQLMPVVCSFVARAFNASCVWV